MTLSNEGGENSRAVPPAVHVAAPPIVESTHDRIVRMIQADMDRAIASHRRRLDEDIYQSVMPASAFPPRPAPTRWERFGWKFRPLRSYVWTLWRALRGDTLETPSEGED